MEDRVKELLARQEIANLVYEYCRALDQVDLEGVAGVFTEDCEVEYGPDPKFNSHGTSQLMEHLRRMWRFSRTSHHPSGVQIAFDGEDHAQGTNSVIAWHEWPDGRQGTLWGMYFDRYVRTPKGWRIAHRRLEMRGNDPGFDSKINRFQRMPPPVGWKLEL